MKPSGIGGMAVMEGVMMKNKDEYAIAIRKPNNEITVERKRHKNFSDKVKLFKLPIFRGILAFIDSMVIGIKVLNFSASFFEDEEETEKDKKPVSEKTNALLMALAVIVSLTISVLLFMVLPVLISNVFSKWVESIFIISLMEGLLRLLIFIGYVLLASQMKEIKRMFMYHGAEHKTINCLENGFELTIENIKWQSKAHKRCGTSFMLLVMLISLVFFVILSPRTLALRVLSRVLLVPAIAGISYEFIRLAGKSESKIVDILSRPGLWMQALTTKEPDDDMIEVALRSVETVYDWKAFLENNESERPQVSSSEVKINSKDKAVPVSKDNKVVQNNKKSNSGQGAKGTRKATNTQEDKSNQKAKSVQEAKSNQKAKSVQESKSNQKAKSVQEPKNDQKVKKTKEDKSAYKDTNVQEDINNIEPVAVHENSKAESTNVKKASLHKKKDLAKSEYAAAGEISIASPKREYEEDDEILRALDKYLDFNDDK